MPFYASFRVDNPALSVKPAGGESDAVSGVDDKLASHVMTATPSSAETAYPRTVITDAHRERLTDFHKDMFRTAANLYPDWDDVILEFNLETTPPSLSFKRPPPSGATKTVNLVVSDTPSPRADRPSEGEISITNEQLRQLRTAAAPANMLSISVGELKSLPQDNPIVQAIGNANDHSFYSRIGEWFIEHFMDRRDYAHLIHHAGQHGVFAYGGYFVELVPNKTDKMLLGSMEDKDRKQYITASAKPDEYFLVAEQRIVEKEINSTSPDQNFCTIITRARYDRNTGKIIGPLMITAEFPEGISAAEAQARTKRLMAAYAAQRATLLSSEEKSHDIGLLALQSPAWSPQSRIAALLCGVLFIAGVVCVILIALHILPVLPFLIDLGMKTGLSTPLLSGLFVGLGTFVTSGVVGLWGFLCSRSSVSSHKSPTMISSTLFNTSADPTTHALPASLGPHGPAAVHTTKPARPDTPIDLAGERQTPTRREDAPGAKPH